MQPDGLRIRDGKELVYVAGGRRCAADGQQQRGEQVAIMEEGRVVALVRQGEPTPGRAVEPEGKRAVSEAEDSAALFAGNGWFGGSQKASLRLSLRINGHGTGSTAALLNAE